MPLLIDLIRAVSEPLIYPSTAANLTITHITADSRQVKPGTLFVALKGEKTDGGAFITQAKQQGAVGALCDSHSTIHESGMALVRAVNPRLALAQMAACFYAKQPKHMVAVTGTDGKTSTADFFRQLCHMQGQRSASIGTLGVISGLGEVLYPGSHTTPDPVTLHHMLAELSASRVTHVAMEASSHGLHQYRLDGVKLEAAAFTNIARDHLDYHRNEENYFHAKARLFAELLPEGKTAVINQDDARFARLQAICQQRRHHIIGFGRSGGEFHIRELALYPQGQKASLTLFGKNYEVEIPLVGAFQTMNILAALGMATGCGLELDLLLKSLQTLRGVPGRLELAAMLNNGASVYVDYAHTPAALGNILRTLRPHTHGKLHVVFGCGGDRDSGKRPEMGKIAAELADYVIVTDDNPRSENPAAIRRAVMDACPDAKEVADRKEAIYGAIEATKKGDVVVIAGKGHEKTQIIGSQALPFDDVQVAREAAGSQ